MAQQGRGLAVFDGTTAARERVLTRPQKGIWDGSPEVARGNVVFVRHVPSNGCGRETIQSLPVAGGRPSALITKAGTIGSIGVSRDGRTLAYASTGCGPSAGSPVRVVDLRTGRAVMSIANPPGSNGSVSAARVILVHNHLVMLLGEHLTTWLVAVDLERPPPPSLASLLSGDLTPSGCQVVDATAQGVEAVVAMARCDDSQRLYRLVGDSRRLELMGPVPRGIHYMSLSAAAGTGWLIGEAHADGSRRIVQLNGGQVRLLPACPQGDRPQACIYSPVWARQLSGATTE